MASDGEVGSVAGLWRFPVKSMRGESLETAEISEQGLPGDRVFAIIDVETGKVVSAKSAKLFPDLLDCSATFVDSPRPGRALPAVRIELPGGQAVTSDSPDLDRTLSAHFGRDVRLARVAPDDFTIDQYHPDIEGADPAGHRNTFVDLFPVSVLTTSTLARLGELEPGSRFDLRRFRMNVIIDTREAGFPENDWIGREITLGDTVRLDVALPDSRCVMTTLAQDDLPRDPDILRSLVRHNSVRVGAAGLFPCAGVYAVVAHPGTLRCGDRVSVTPA